MKVFRQRLSELNPPAADRRWIFVPYDQLSDEIGPLSRESPESLGIVLAESSEKASRRPYHRQKLALVLTNLRHFALEQAERGVAVRHVVTEGPYGEALRPLTAKLGPLRVMEPAERELREDLAPLVSEGAVEVVPHEGWLTTPDQFRRSSRKGPPWRMDAFYRLVRRESDILMEDGKPVGGKFSFDAENRKPWKGEPPAPVPPRFEPDDITREVADLIQQKFSRHPGRLDLAMLPASRDDAKCLWSWALETCLEHFGPYEDAMSTRSRSLFHTRVSALVNLHRLLPRDLIADVAGLDAPLASREGFIRQVLGWREFMRHVHRETRGFRRLPSGQPPSSGHPGDGGWEAWSGQAWSRPDDHPGFSSDAAPSALDADWPLPPTYWGEPSGLNCLDQVVTEVWEDAYSHHIPRLMILANIGTLLGVTPRQLTDWFWVAFADAYDWVVEPNVLGMGTYAVGGLFTTKPYVSGANYISRMADYCDSCRFDPKSDCPITRLYWSFLERNRVHFEGNPRMRLAMRSLDRRPRSEQERDRRTFESVQRTLTASREVSGVAD
jgi:deoxyribodipyrimidine photolyase-related protein